MREVGQLRGEGAGCGQESGLQKPSSAVGRGAGELPFFTASAQACSTTGSSQGSKPTEPSALKAGGGQEGKAAQLQLK